MAASNERRRIDLVVDSLISHQEEKMQQQRRRVYRFLQGKVYIFQILNLVFLF